MDENSFAIVDMGMNPYASDALRAVENMILTPGSNRQSSQAVADDRWFTVERDSGLNRADWAAWLRQCDLDVRNTIG
jgi:hypothetical protein